MAVLVLDRKRKPLSHCRILQRGDGFGYGYAIQPLIAHTERKREQGRAPRATLSLPGMNARVSRENG
jgi:hypothetical protein